jgi:beta-carotene 3-hydroxylase
MTASLVVVATFLGMEAVSYATHRFVMHGAGMVWHRSHHVAATGRLERNDLFPVVFAAAAVLLFAGATSGPGRPVLWWVATGVSAYGSAYLFVHEVYIHRRIPLRLPSLAYLEWLREAHRIHHLFGGEPYGMLLPVVPRALRARAGARGGVDPLARAERRRNTRSTRSRL